MDVSVVIPTFNRCSLLKKTLPALVSQDAEGFDYEVIVVNNGSSDATAEVLTQAAATWGPRLRCFHLPPTGGPSAPRNVGLRKALSPVVIIIDDDVLPDPGFVAAHWRFHREHPQPNFCALGEAYVPDRLREDPMTFFHEYPYDSARAAGHLGGLYFWTCNVSAKRQFLLQAGGFDEDYLCYEDVILGLELEKLGMALRLLPEARAQHLHEMSLSSIERRGRLMGEWLVPLVQRFPDPAIKHRFGLLSAEIGPARYLRRLANRAAFRVLDNPLPMWMLRGLVVDRRRSRLSDLYYYILFRRHMIAGYHTARLHGPPLVPNTQACRNPNASGAEASGQYTRP